MERFDERSPRAPVRLQTVLNHPAVTGAGIRLARIVPRRASTILFEAAATAICRSRPLLYQTVRNNLRHVLGESADEALLEATTRALFVHAGRANYEFFRALGQRAEPADGPFRLPAETVAEVRAAVAAGRGVLLLGAHLGNFNLGIRALSSLVEAPVLALSIANPNAGFKLLNQLRSRWGIELTPISLHSLRQAVKRLETGGVVLTAFDHPQARPNDLIPLFDRPSYLPLGPARLARVENTLVLLGSCVYDPVQRYAVQTHVLEVERTRDRHHDTMVNARRMAQVLEGYVAARPEQWLMFYPVWPDR